MSQFILTDSSSNNWLLGVTDAGAYTTTPTGTIGVNQILLQDTITSVIWAMTVSTLGALTVTLSSGSALPYIPVNSPDGTQWGIAVVNGAISTILALAGITGVGCNPLLRDPLNRFWALGVLDNGQLTTTLTSIVPLFQNGPILTVNQQNNWQLSADIQGRIVSTNLNYQPTIQLNLPYIPLLSPSGFAWNLTITSFGLLETTATSSLFPEVIPYIPDVSMSIYGTKNEVFCPSCGNATVVVSADLSCWCCACSSFVLPEDTNIIVVLEE
jgi:hypothetical protein